MTRIIAFHEQEAVAPLSAWLSMSKQERREYRAAMKKAHRARRRLQREGRSI